MENIEDIIRYESECGYVEFKAEAYFKNGFVDFVKDMMAMANGSHEGHKYIIIGVLEKDGNKIFEGLTEGLQDSAHYDQVVHQNIEPEIGFTCRTVTVDGRSFGVFTIESCEDKPYMMKKGFRNLMQGECYIRKGTTTARLIRRDVDDIWKEKSRTGAFDGDITVTSIINGQPTEVIPIARFAAVPSQVEANKITRRMEKLTLGQTGSSHETSGLEMDYYAYMNIEQLQERLTNVQTTFSQEDSYFKFETNGAKVNFSLWNTGTMYVQDVTMQLVIPALPGLEIAPKVYHSPSSFGVTSFLDTTFTTQRRKYPEVRLMGDRYEISQPLEDLPHRRATKLFVTDMRVFADYRVAGKEITANCTIWGKNLAIPIQRSVTIRFGV